MAKDPIPRLVWPAGPKPSLVLALLEIAIVFLLLATPLLSADFGILTVLGSLGVAAFYVILATAAPFWRAGADLPSKPRVALFLVVQLVSGTVVVAGLGLLVSSVWLWSAYREIILDTADFAFAFPPSLSTLVFLAPAAIVAAAAVFLLAVTLLRRDGETAGQCLARIRSWGIGNLWPAVVAWLLLGLAATSLLNVLATVVSPPTQLLADDPYGDIDGWLLVAEHPGFAAALLAPAILFVAFRRAQPAALGSLRRPPRATRFGTPAALAVLASIGAACGWYLHVLHLGTVMALGSNMMIVGWGEVSRATDAWIARQQTAGRDPADIASDLSSHGTWTTEGSGAGLPALFPELDEDLSDLGLREGCTVTIGAGVADNSALPADGWLEGYVAAFRPLPEVSYCIRLACPSPAVWQETPVVILHSSHPSRNRSWAYNVHLDILGAGAAPEAGGYCTADGGLAESYQG
jgi:hypothetical protein